MTIQQIRYALEIAETGSINKAAEKLFVSQPSLTNALRELEKSLGITIFNRSGHGMTLTNDGREFIQRAQQVYSQFDDLQKTYSDPAQIKRKFSVSTQHYSFAVKAFVDLVRQYDTNKYDFSIMEKRTKEVIDHTASMRSEIGILYLSDFNRKVINRQLAASNLEFHHLIDVEAFVYLYKNHPLAKCSSISFDMLTDYPCLSFDQGNNPSAYYAEEILSYNNYPRMIHTNDRATNLNLMVGLNGYTLCPGIISEELNGNDFISVPFASDEENTNSDMDIGYITIKNHTLTHIGAEYVQALKNILDTVEGVQKTPAGTES